MGKHVEPRLGRQSFTCPHCGALAHQTWFHLFVSEYDKDNGPEFPPEDRIEPSWVRKRVESTDEEEIIAYLKKIWARNIFFTEIGEGEQVEAIAENLDLSCCSGCGEVAIWVADRLVHPPRMAEMEITPDVPDDVRPDVEEAARILDVSPRAAAALLRLSIQRILLGIAAKETDLDEAVRALAGKGLGPQIQRALDVARVIGRKAASPGQICPGDDRDTALTLLSLINLIANTMITQPRLMDRLLESLPDAAKTS